MLLDLTLNASNMKSLMPAFFAAIALGLSIQVAAYDRCDMGGTSATTSRCVLPNMNTPLICEGPRDKPSGICRTQEGELVDCILKVVGLREPQSTWCEISLVSAHADKPTFTVFAVQSNRQRQSENLTRSPATTAAEAARNNLLASHPQSPGHAADAYIAALAYSAAQRQSIVDMAQRAAARGTVDGYSGRFISALQALSGTYGSNSVPSSVVPVPPSVPRSVIDVQSGQFFPGVAGGIVNPRNGQFLPDVGAGYIDTATGRFVPKL